MSGFRGVFWERRRVLGPLGAAAAWASVPPRVFSKTPAANEATHSNSRGHPEKVHDLNVAPVRRSYSDIQLILGGNLCRLLAQTRKEPKHTPPPQEKTTGEKNS